MKRQHQSSHSVKKAYRAKQVSKIVVTVTRADGTVLSFDGNEESQARLDRFSRGAINRGLTELPWKMADNSTVMVTPAEMIEAWMLGADGQGEVWFI